MSCNGCRVLKRGCPESCVLRPCLDWIESPISQGNATIFLTKFFGRADLFNFISAVQETERPALFQSLLFEACGRTLNPVSGAVGLFYTGNWHLCQKAVQTVFIGGTLQPSFAINFIYDGINFLDKKETTRVPSETNDQSEMVASLGVIHEKLGGKEPKLLNLFV